MSAAAASGERGSQDQDQEKKPTKDQLKKPVTDQDQEKKPATDQGSSHITIKIKGQHVEEPVSYRVKRNIQLRKLMIEYCDSHSQDFNSLVFLLDGKQFSAYQTPDELEMEDGDLIDAFDNQFGGGF